MSNKKDVDVERVAERVTVSTDEVDNWLKSAVKSPDSDEPSKNNTTTLREK